MAATAATKSCKVILLGNGSVGKTSICARFLENGFSPEYKQTVGLDTLSKQVTIRGKDVQLQVWDIGGQAVNSKMLSKYISGCDVALLTYDLTDLQSFADVESWVRRVASTVAMTGRQAPAMYLLGNKADLVGDRVVGAKAISEAVQAHGLQGHYEVSAQSGDSIMRSFYDVAARAIGVSLSDLELEAHDTVVAATVRVGGQEDEARVSGSGGIEAEDLAAERAKQGAGCQCVLS